MKSHQQRLKAIELSLTLQQVVANAVLRTMRESVKGQPEPSIEQGVLQARKEADLLYQLVVNANVPLPAWAAESARRTDFSPMK